MTPAQVPQSALQALPEAIWIPTGKSGPNIYRGTPLEIVRVMASEMGMGVTIPNAVRQISGALAKTRGIKLQFQPGLPDDELARLFVFALLHTGIGKEMARA